MFSLLAFNIVLEILSPTPPKKLINFRIKYNRIITKYKIPYNIMRKIGLVVRKM